MTGASRVNRRGTSNKNQLLSWQDRLKLRQAVLDRDGNGETMLCCFGCGTVLQLMTMTLDRHPVGGYEGGRYTLDNVRGACGPCNSSAGSIAMHRRLGHKIKGEAA